MKLEIQALLMLTPFILLGALFCTIQYWRFCRRVETDWMRPVPQREPEATNDLFARAGCERMRMRYAIGMIACYGLSGLAAIVLYSLERQSTAFHLILAATLLMWIGAFRAVRYEGRANKRGLENPAIR